MIGFIVIIAAFCGFAGFCAVCAALSDRICKEE